MGRVVVVHPDLGVGGAERLIVDASRALQESGHEVIIYTGFHNKNRCFEETKDGTLKTYALGSWIPRSIFGRFHALLAYMKMIYIAFYLILFSKHDLILCDQVSACIPILKYTDFRNRKCKIVFYCHFPDQLLTQRETLAKALYRKPIDLIEEYSTAAADVILVNSKFTSSVVRRTFKTLYKRELTILYPCVDLKLFTRYKRQSLDKYDAKIIKCYDDSNANFTFLSINRFETKKNLALAIKALSEAISGYEVINRDQKMKVRLIIAGGYDDRLDDCVSYYNKLEDLVGELSLQRYVTFIKSPSDMEKLFLLEFSDVIVYTPENEHFGIVPLEAMAMSKPIIASASGGPLETIENDVNGILCEPDRYAFADAMLRLYNETNLCKNMGTAGFLRVKKNFSYEAFRTKLNKICYPVTH